MYVYGFFIDKRKHKHESDAEDNDAGGSMNTEDPKLGIDTTGQSSTTSNVRPIILPKVGN